MNPSSDSIAARPPRVTCAAAPPVAGTRQTSSRPVRFDPTLLGLYAADGRPLATAAIARSDLATGELAVPAELAAGAELDIAVGFLDTGADLPAFVDLRQSVFSPGVRVSAS